MRSKGLPIGSRKLRIKAKLSGLSIALTFLGVVSPAHSQQPPTGGSYTITTIAIPGANLTDARAVEPSRIIATGVRISHPTVEIWSKVFWFKSSFADFTRYTTDITEQTLKSFVNDWTKSQH
jgi:hypothetical protein